MLADSWKRWLELFFWWLPGLKGEQTSGEDAGATPTAADTVSTYQNTIGDKTDTSPHKEVVDEVTVIKGIGPSIQTKLERLGVTSLAALAAADPETLVAKLNASQPISAKRVKGWVEEAQKRVAGRT